MNFERGQDPKSAMGIGNRALIKKWFDDLDVSPEEYTIDDNFNIFFKGFLNLRNTLIISLPANLSIGGYLDLSNSQIASLPDNLSVGGNIYKDF